MILQDFHVHTSFCDGENTIEDMICAAVEKGLSVIGFSGHSYTFFDESYCMSKEDTQKYIAEIARLKEKYRDKISVLCGTEQDFYSDMPTDGYDYIIGSVHYLYKNGEYFALDESADILKKAAAAHYGGDFYALAEDYFQTVSQIPEKINPNILGHFDLITKFNEKEHLFDERSPRYIAAYRAAADAIIAHGTTFEVNTGAISRGYKSYPYPSRDILEYLCAKGANVILTSDCHSKGKLCFEFEKYAAELKDIGFDLKSEKTLF